MRSRRLLVGALAVLACAGCGKGAEGEVRTTVDRFSEAMAAKDAGLLCRDLLARRLTDRIRAAGLQCEAVLQTALQDVERPEVTVRSVRVDGDSAVAEVRTTAADQQPTDAELNLVKEDGRWRIASLGGVAG